MLSFWLQIHVICSELKSAKFNPFTRCILFSFTHAHKNVRCASCYFKLQLESLSALFKSLTFSSKAKVVKSVRICLLVCVSQCAQVVLCRTSLKPKAIREARWWAGLTVNNCIDRRSLQQKRMRQGARMAHRYMTASKHQANTEDTLP